jgi:hypothetical protein
LKNELRSSVGRVEERKWRFLAGSSGRSFSCRFIQAIVVKFPFCLRNPFAER